MNRSAKVKLYIGKHLVPSKFYVILIQISLQRDFLSVL